MGVKNSFRSILYGMGHSELDTFSWIKDKRIINSKISPNICLRKSSLKKRVFDKLYENSINNSSINKISSRNEINTITKSLLPNYSLNNYKPILKPNIVRYKDIVQYAVKVQYSTLHVFSKMRPYPIFLLLDVKQITIQLIISL